ncbi:MAG: hypothetical protein ACHQUA_00070 [Microgenomates group bacterium]
MRERLQVKNSSDGRIYQIGRGQGENIRKGCVAAEGDGGYTFSVLKGDQAALAKSLSELGQYLDNRRPHFTEAIVKRLVKNVQLCLIPPVEVIGPSRVLSNGHKS